MKMKQKFGFAKFGGIAILFAIINSANGCVSMNPVQMTARYTSSKAPIVEQSILSREFENIHIIGIDGKKNVYDHGIIYFVLTPGEHQVTVRYVRVAASNALSVAMGYSGTLRETTLSSTRDFTFTFNFLPGHLYEIRGFDWLQDKGLPPNNLGFAVIDFTDNNFEIVWITNESSKDYLQKRLKRSNTYRMDKKIIKAALDKDKVFY
jgi:hypothetical protein